MRWPRSAHHVGPTSLAFPKSKEMGESESPGWKWNPSFGLRIVDRASWRAAVWCDGLLSGSTKKIFDVKSYRFGLEDMGQENAMSNWRLVPMDICFADSKLPLFKKMP
ncbi:hypothetical protein HPP92_008044 [Vanilla planifolia]|uniref:Uncharacterized protein n=1 Tax=Vanilla planifolia TaxID=51239 RepID=A0A835RFE2_VANPL|nr:hypothetical protein HPP92_008044 [Vanilla planifolia]